MPRTGRLLRCFALQHPADVDSGTPDNPGRGRRRRPPGRQRGQHAALPGCLSLECRHRRPANPTGTIVAADEQFERLHARSCGLVGWSHRRAGQAAWDERWNALVAGGASAILRACGDAIVTDMARTNANDPVLIVVR